MSDSKASCSGGVGGLGGFLFVVFLCLKLTGTINWSWWWVTAPLWGPVAILLAIAAVCVLIGLVVKLWPE